jgi:large subunit ribosomal protein L5
MGKLTMVPRQKERYLGPVCEKLMAELGVSNRMALPRLRKIVLTVGLGKQLEGTKINAKAKEQVLKDLAAITGQKAVMTKAKKSVSNFKVRAGYESGAMVTLRGERMWEFFDRLVSLAIPRIKDFRGLKATGFDKAGNYSFGITEQGIFTEVDMANAEYMHGMNVTFVISNGDPVRSRALLREMGLPFVKEESAAA